MSYVSCFISSCFDVSISLMFHVSHASCFEPMFHVHVYVCLCFISFMLHASCFMLYASCP
jgi:hypothetical protein